MTDERVQTTLRFVGGWPWWAGLLLAIVLGAAAWMLYRHETRPLRWWVKFGLPALRVLAVMLIVLMLSGPILHHRKTIGQLSRLWLFVDGSQSMELTDPSMDAGRKIAILQRLGLLREDAVKMDLPHASAALSEAKAMAERGRNLQSAPVDEWKTLVAAFTAKIAEARGALGGAVEPPRADAFARELADPARELAARPSERVDDRVRAIGDLVRLGDLAKRWSGELREAFDRSIRDQAASDSSPLGSALAKFNTMPRWQRLQSELLTGEGTPLLGKLGERHDIQLLELAGGAARKLWQPTSADSALPAALPKPVGEISNLATGLKNAASGQEKSQAGAIVLFSDGQHNEGESPVEVAKILAGRGVPIFTVGLGADSRPRDLAIVKVDAPDAVFFEDRVRGQIVLKDDMPAGQPFTVTVKDGDKAVWEQSFVTDGQNVRRVGFDFPISDLVKERIKKSQTDQQISGVPVELSVAVSQIEGDSQPANNLGNLRLRTDRLTINIVEAGSGPAVLLLHGLGWDHSLWNPTVERLATRYHVIAADTRGHGKSDKPDGPYDMEMFARDYAALADALGLTGICVVGLSQGGMVAQRLALLRPDLVSSLVLISTSCKSAPSLRENMESRIAAMDKMGPEAAAGIAAESIFSPGWRAANAVALARFIAWRSVMPSAPLNAATRALYDFNLSHELPRIAVPTLVVAGQEDVLTRPEGMEEIAALIPGAEYRLIPKTGHMIPVEQPEPLDALLSTFLRTHVH